MQVTDHEHRLFMLCACILIVVHSGLLAWSAYRHSPTLDEPAHLAAGISHWSHANFDLYVVNPPLVRMIAALPVLILEPKVDWKWFMPVEEGRAEFLVGRSFSEANGQRVFWFITVARWMCLPFSVLGALICYCWADSLFGKPCGLMALCLWCFSPTILGNGSLITTDVPSAAMFVTSSYLYWIWMRFPSGRNAFVAGVALGIALLTKSTALLLFGVNPLLWLVAVRSSYFVHSGSRVVVELCQCLAVHAIALVILNAGYAFGGTCIPLGQFDFRSQALSGVDGELNDRVGGNIFQDTWLSGIPVPLPFAFVKGVDEQKQDFEEGRLKFFLGEYRSGSSGWWYFYLYAVLIKVPIGALLIGLIAFFQSLQGRLIDSFMLLFPVSVILLLVSSQTGLNCFRYLLPAFPFVIVWSSQAARSFVAQARLRQLFCLGATSWFVFSSLSVYPHSLSYFNEFTGGPQNGFRLMVDCNSDWGQDLLYLREWFDREKAESEIDLSYFGPVRPGLAGINTMSENMSETQMDHRKHWLVVSVTDLQLNRRDEWGALPENDILNDVANRNPDQRIGYSIHAYRLDLIEP